MDQNLDQTKKRIYLTNAAGVALISAWGLNKWGYGEHGFHSENEGWFGHNTYSGGSDKFGHAYSAYVLTRGLSLLYHKWDQPRDDAALYGALSSFGLMSYMEIADGFSDFGFSYEDVIINGAGTALGYWLDTHPDIANKLDFRVEYRTSFSEADAFNAHDKMKYLFAFKLSGLQSTHKNLFRYLEIHLGYYTRGYDNETDNKQRILYTAIGINLSELFRLHATTRPAAGLFNYLQLPDTYLAYNHRLDAH